MNNSFETTKMNMLGLHLLNKNPKEISFMTNKQIKK